MFESYTSVLAGPLGAVVAVSAGAVVGATTVGAVVAVGAASVVPGAWVGAAGGAAVGTALAAGAQGPRTMANRGTIENKAKRFCRSMVVLLRGMELVYT